MGFLLFAARQMQLKREINHNSYEQIVVQDQLKAAHTKVTQFNEQMNNMKNMTSVFAEGIKSNGSIAAYRAAAANENTPAEVKEAINKMLAGDMSALNGLTNEQRQALSQVGQMGSQAGSSLATAFTNVSGSIFDAINRVELAKLQAQENQLQLKSDSLKQEGQLLATELQSYEEALGSAVKEAAPKFGLA